MIKLVDGTELAPLNITGARQEVQGQKRDVITFVFPSTMSMDELDNIFTESNCERITIVDGENEYIHRGYTIRHELARKQVEISQETDEVGAVYEQRILLSVAQRTYIETQLANLIVTQSEQDEALMELAELIG